MKRPRTALLSALLLMMGWTVARAQDTPSATPPPDLPAHAYQMPPITTRTLPNGLKVIVAESRRVPLVTMRLAVNAGSILDPPDAPGLAEAVASQMTAGTDKMTSLQLREAAERLGGSVGVSAGDDYATVVASALAENLRPITDLMADVLLNPAFPDSELNIYKSLTMQRLVIQRQNPAFLAGEQIAHVLYGPHPYGTVSTTSAAVQALTRDTLTAFYKAHYTPQNAVLVVVGNVNPQTVFEAVQNRLGSWSGNAPATAEFPAPPTSDARRIYLINRPGSVQSNIVLGNLAIKRGDPDYYALLLANTILGGSSGSRLFANVREKQGYAYSVSSGLDARGLAGDFTESAQTRTAVTAAALQEMLSEAERIRTEPVGAAELQSAKNYIDGSFVLSLTSQAGLADRLLTVEVYHLPADYLTTFRAKIDAVTVADVQRVAQKYILPEKAAIVVVGDADQLRAGLKAVGEVEDVNGKG